MFEHVGRLVVTHKKTILVGLFLATLASLALLPGLRFDFTPQALFEQKDEINAFAKSIRAEFGDDTNTLLVVWRGDEPGEVFEPTALADIRRITDWLEASDDAIRVTSLANMHLPRNERTPSGEWSLNLGELVPSVDETNPALARQVAKWVNEEPLLERVVVSADGSKTTFVVELSEEARQINTLLGVVDRLDAQLAIWEKDLDSHPDLELSGLPSVRVDIITALQKEQMRFLPITGVLMSLLLLWMFRRAAGVLLPITSVLLALAWTMAILVLIDQPINIINSVLPTLMMIIGLSDGIHLLSRASEEATVDRPREEIIVSTVKHMGMACFLTSLTTAIGFGSLVMARTEILQNFGLHTAMGVMLTYVSTLLFIPAMLTWMRPPVRSGLTATSPGLIERGMVYISLYVRTYPKRQVVIGVALIGAAAAASVAWGNIDTRLLETFPEGHKTRVLTHEVEDEFSGVLPLIISIDAEEKGYFEAPENLQKLSALAQTVKARDPEMVLKTASVYDLLQVFRSAYLNDPSLRDTPFANRAQVKTVLRLYRQDAEADVNRWLDPENRHALVSVRIRDLGAKRGKALVAIVVEEVEALFGEGSAEGVIDAKPPPHRQKVQVRLAGDVYLASAGMMNFIYDLMSSLGMASFLIFGVMTLLFRSVRIGLISILPNILPLVGTSGWMALRGIELNTSTVIIFSISLGLAVDDTIHFLSRYKEERKQGFSINEAVERTYLGAGRAIVITSVVLICGLAVLLTTDFMPTRYFAELSGCTVIGALAGDLFILPACLILFDKETASGAPQDSVQEQKRP
ncbi:MAG: hypothetical protein CO108_12215 [Deltaproteobacteria bacterium CG_4_9_14_3_um_filter_63_12]|nr:MAG: hypothetical protein CO108_12215 [Deltaproteobacteria bacterium CG_4_9_14_3_um_filter_63_12]